MFTSPSPTDTPAAYPGPPSPRRLFRGPFEDLVSLEDEEDEEEEEEDEDAKSEVQYHPIARSKGKGRRISSSLASFYFVDMIFRGTVTLEGTRLVSFFFVYIDRVRT